MTERLLGRWRKQQDEALALQGSTSHASVSFSAASRFLRQGVQVMMMTIGAYLVLTQAASAGVMIATTVLLGRALQPVEQIVGSWRVLNEARSAYRRLRDLCGHFGKDEPHMSLPRPVGRVAGRGRLVPSAGHGEAGADGRVAEPRSRRGAGHHRSERCRQVHAGAPADGHLAADHRNDPAGRHRPVDLVAARARALDRLRAAGRGTVRRHGGRQHRPPRGT